MPNYQQGKVYKIVSGDLVYIGSTTAPTLAKRLSQHILDFKKWKNGKSGMVSVYPLFETKDYHIVLLESCPCNTKDELTARERFWIEQGECVNIIKKPFQTREEKLDYLRTYHKTYKK